MKGLMIGLLMLLLPAFCIGKEQSAQLVISGKLIDTETKDPIPYANIYFENNYFGTMSNEEGEFELKVGALPVTLVVSHLAYHTRQLTVNKEQVGIIALDPNIIVLKEVSLSLPQSEINHILAVAEDKNSSLNYGKAFFRKLQKVDKTYTELQEMFFDASFSSHGIEGWIPKNARYAVPKHEKDRYFVFTNYIYLTGLSFYTREESDILNPISNQASQYYDLSFVGVRWDGDRKIGEIKAKAKANLGKPALEGSIFYDADTYDLVALQWFVRYHLGASTEKETKNARYDFAVSFKPPKASRVFLEKIEISFQGEIYATGKYRNVNIRSVCFVYEYAPSLASKSEQFTPINLETEEMSVVDQLPYAAAFWDENPVIKQTGVEKEVVRSFNKTGSVGNAKFTIKSKK